MQQLRCIPKRIGFAVIAVLIVVAGAHAGDIALFDGKSVAAVVYEQTDGVPIAKAAALLAHDLTSLTGHKPLVASGMADIKGSAVVIGLANSPAIAAILRANKIDTTAIEGKWETYGRAVVPAPWDPNKKALLIFGSDVRGTI